MIVIAIATAVTGRLSAIATVERVANEQRAARDWRFRTELGSVDPIEFKGLVAAYYRFLGYRTILTPKTGDYGLDVIALRGDESLGIQCKRYLSKVGYDGIKEAHTGSAYWAHAHGPLKPVVITTNDFTPNAISGAAGTGVRLIDGDELVAMLQSANIFLADAAAATPIVKKAPGWVASGSALGVQVVLAIWAAWMLVTHLTTAFR